MANRSAHTIFTDGLDKKRAATKIIPKLLNFEQTQRRMDIGQEMLMTLYDVIDVRL